MIFIKIIRKSLANRWELIVLDFWPLISARNTSFYGHFWTIQFWAGDDSQNEASLAAIMVQQEGPSIGGGLVAIFAGSSGNRRPIVGD